MIQRQPPRESYKAFLMDYDALLAYSDKECCFSLSEREVQILLAQIEYVGWKTRYIPTSTEIDSNLINRWQDNLARKLMSGCCPDNDLIYRFAPDGTYESSDDGGETWIPAPEADPRRTVVGVPPLPGSDGDNKKCAAADNIRDQYLNMRNNTMTILTGGATVLLIVAGLVGAIGGIFASTVVGAAIAPMLFGLAGLLLTLTPESVEEQIDSEALDTFRCIIFCNIGDDGRVSVGQLDDILADIADQFDGFPETFFYTITASLGAEGLNNAAAMGVSSASDCDCDCSPGEWCYRFDFESSDGDWDVLYGAWSAGGWEGTSAGSGVSIVVYKAGLPGFNITHMEMEVEAAFQCNIAVIIDDAVGTFTDVNVGTGSYSWDGDISGTKITLNPSSGGSQGAQVTMKAIKFSGTGDNPFGADNC